MNAPILREGELRLVPILADLDDAEHAWLAAQGTLRLLEPGDYLFREGDPADFMALLLEGEVIGRREVGEGPTFTLTAPRATGLLPFSRMTQYIASGRARLPGRAFLIPKAVFPELLQRLPRLEARFVGLITDRVRETTHLADQHDRLVALGKLAAGLAHELNNPASALGRANDELRGTVQELTAACALLAGRPEGAQKLAALEKVAAASRRVPLDAMARSDAEEALAVALDQLGVPGAWRQAAELVEAGLPPDAVLQVLRELPPESRAPVLDWTAARLGTQRLFAQVADAVDRIRQLVDSVKTYAHVDRAPSVTDTDIAAGLHSTLTLLGHAVRDAKLTVKMALPDDLPTVPAFPAELNQVWTNLIDNAVDALPPHGTITVRALADAEAVTVEIEDDGPGIPPEVQARMWEQFYTTKPLGMGTGLGLDIAKRIIENRHGGTLTCESRPGRTVFRTRLPRVRTLA